MSRTQVYISNTFFVMLLPSLNKKRVGRYADGLFLMVTMAVGSGISNVQRISWSVCVCDHA
jgi:hypothetical protein